MDADGDNVEEEDMVKISRKPYGSCALKLEAEENGENDSDSDSDSETNDTDYDFGGSDEKSSSQDTRNRFNTYVTSEQSETEDEGSKGNAMSISFVEIGMNEFVNGKDDKVPPLKTIRNSIDSQNSTNSFEKIRRFSIEQHAPSISSPVHLEGPGDLGVSDELNGLGELSLVDAVVEEERELKRSTITKSSNAFECDVNETEDAKTNGLRQSPVREEARQATEQVHFTPLPRATSELSPTEITNHFEKSFSEMETTCVVLESHLITTNPDNQCFLALPGTARVTNFRITFQSAIFCDCAASLRGFHSTECSFQGHVIRYFSDSDSWQARSTGIVRRAQTVVYDFDIPVYSVKKIEIMNTQEIRLVCKGLGRYMLRFKSRQLCQGFFNICKVQCFKPLKDCLALKLGYGNLSNPGWTIFDLEDDYRRLGMLSNSRLKLITQGSKYELCGTYPRQLIVPSNISMFEIKRCSQFRSKARFPVGVWRHGKSGAILARCSQPLVGLTNARCFEDEKLVVSLLLDSGYQFYSSLIAGAGSTNGAQAVNGNRKVPTHAVRSPSPPPGTSQRGGAGADLLSKKVVIERSHSSNEIGDGMSQMFSGFLSKLNRSLQGSSGNPARHMTYTNRTFDQKLDYMNKPRVGRNGNRSGDGKEAGLTIHEQDYFYIMDARSQIATYGNRAFGRGTENSNNYLGCKLKFMNIDNIHGLRRAFEELGKVVQPGFVCDSLLKAIEETGTELVIFLFLCGSYLCCLGWTKQARGILSATMQVVKFIAVEGKSVLVHCSDGWDRTAQITSLAQLLLDPFYRTVTGFAALIEKEWFCFGHKFKDRYGYQYHTDHARSTTAITASVDPSMIDQMSPVFTLWLDAVWQIQRQFPTAFEFNAAFLLHLSDNIDSGRYGTFMVNSLRERNTMSLRFKSESIWQRLLSDVQFRNTAYESINAPLVPSLHSHNIRVWKENYLRNITDLPS